VLKSVFSKSLYEKRWGLLWWFLAMFLMTFFVMSIFPTFKDTFGQQLNNVPDSLKAILGEASDYQRIEGFIELQIFLQMIFLTVIYGVVLFTGLLAGDENDGTLQTLLAQPVSRSRVYWHKLLAGLLLSWLVTFGLFIGVVLGAQIINEPVNLWRLFQGTCMVWLVTLVYSLIGYVLGAITGRRGMAGALAGIFAFVTYMLNSLVGAVPALKVVNNVSPIKYLSSPRVMDHGLNLINVSLLVGVSAVLVLLGWALFKKRDIYQR
jgi:ABC-2 type transport system permease protein